MMILDSPPRGMSPLSAIHANAWAHDTLTSGAQPYDVHSSRVGKLALCLVFFACVSVSMAADQLDKFKLITGRNIFDSTRTVRRKVVHRPPAPKPKPEPKEYLKLTGVVVLNGEAQALVRGTKVSGMYQVGQELEGLKIEQLDTQEAVVVVGEKKLTWPVGKSLQRNGAKTWEASFSEPSFTVAATTAKHTEKSVEKPSEKPKEEVSKPKAASSREAILKRLMERRRKELKQ